MTENEAISYLARAAKRGSRLGLERISELCRLLGEPQNTVPAVHIAGTNGKGSCGAMLSSILTAAGYRTGWFSSPAITGITDYFRIDGECISGDGFASVMGDIVPVCESMDDKPTEFEVLTAAAFELFRREKCDIMIIECGMGGDTDSTNVIASPVLSVITNIRLDHSGFLGDTVEEIAVHKAGIIKPGVPVVFSGSDEAAADTVEKRAEECGSELIIPSADALVSRAPEISGIELRWLSGGSAVDIHIPLLGAYQRENALISLTAVEMLRKKGFDIPDSAVVSGLASVRWHGRFELLRTDPVVLYDGAHNPDGMKMAAATLKSLFPGQRVAVVMGVMADKEYSLYTDILSGLAEKVFTVTPDNPRSLDCRELAEVFRNAGINAQAYPVLSEGVRAAVGFAKESSCPLAILGTLYMYGEVTAAM